MLADSPLEFDDTRYDWMPTTATYRSFLVFISRSPLDERIVVVIAFVLLFFKVSRCFNVPLCYILCNAHLWFPFVVFYGRVSVYTVTNKFVCKTFIFRRQSNHLHGQCLQFILVVLVAFADNTSTQFSNERINNATILRREEGR